MLRALNLCRTLPAFWRVYLHPTQCFVCVMYACICAVCVHILQCLVPLKGWFVRGYVYPEQASARVFPRSTTLCLKRRQWVTVTCRKVLSQKAASIRSQLSRPGPLHPVAALKMKQNISPRAFHPLAAWGSSSQTSNPAEKNHLGRNNLILSGATQIMWPRLTVGP